MKLLNVQRFSIIIIRFYNQLQIGASVIKEVENVLHRRSAFYLLMLGTGIWQRHWVRCLRTRQPTLASGLEARSSDDHEDVATDADEITDGVIDICKP